MLIRGLQEEEVDSFFTALKNSATQNGIGNRFAEDSEALRNAIFKEKHSAGLVVEGENGLVGYLLYSITRRNFLLHPNHGLYLHSLYVDVPFRRQKVGTRLMEALIKIARENDFNRIEFALLRSNHVGELFLQSLSFQEVDFIKPMRLTLA